MRSVLHARVSVKIRTRFSNPNLLFMLSPQQNRI